LKTRKKIIDSARRLFNRYGFENVSITQIMAGAELTHGGFYTYFTSKSELYAEVLNCFSPTRNGRIVGKACMWTSQRRMSARKW
jgi:DNA-binding transcriptional regulator YbjK